MGIEGAGGGGGRADIAGSAETIQAKIPEYSDQGGIQKAGGKRVLGGIPY